MIDTEGLKEGRYIGCGRCAAEWEAGAGGPASLFQYMNLSVFVSGRGAVIACVRHGIELFNLNHIPDGKDAVVVHDLTTRGTGH